MVAEKPSLARSLAEILSHKRCRRRKSACHACDVYEFEGSFPPWDKRGGSAANFKMTSVCGHVMSLDFLPKYNKWDQVDPVSGDVSGTIHSLPSHEPSHDLVTPTHSVGYSRGGHSNKSVHKGLCNHDGF